VCECAFEFVGLCAQRLPRVYSTSVIFISINVCLCVFVFVSVCVHLNL